MNHKVSSVDFAPDRRTNADWLREQLEDLADHVANAHRPSKARTAEAIRNIVRGYEWRLGKLP